MHNVEVSSIFHINLSGSSPGMKAAILLLLTLIAGAIVACAPPNTGAGSGQDQVGPQGNPPATAPAATGAPARGPGGFNMTPEQRQQMMQQAADACQNKAAGDGCVLQSPRGERNGTCEQQNNTQQNSTLVCRGSFRQRPPMTGPST